MRSDQERWMNSVTDTVKNMGDELAEIQRFQRDCEQDKMIGMLMQLSEKQMAQSSNYTNLIMVAGYAGFLGLWSTLVTKLPHWLYALSGLLILISLLVFVSWEIIKMVWSTIYLGKINEQITKTVRGPKAFDTIVAAHSRHAVKINKLWKWFLIPSVGFGIAAALLLIGDFAYEVWKSVP